MVPPVAASAAGAFWGAGVDGVAFCGAGGLDGAGVAAICGAGVLDGGGGFDEGGGALTSLTEDHRI